MNTQDDVEQVMALIKVFGGKEALLDAHLRAMETMTITEHTVSGWLFGGEFTLQIKFDGHKTKGTP